MRTLRRVLAAVALVACTGLLVARAEPPAAYRLEARLPASTLAFASVENVHRFGERASKTALAQLMSDPEMQAFLKPIVGAVHEVAAGSVSEMPPALKDGLALLGKIHGQVSLALVSMDVRQDKPTLALSIDFGGASDEFVAFLTKLQQEMDPGGDLVKSSMRDGRQVWDADVGPVAIHATVKDGAFVVATDEALLARLVGDEAPDGLGQQADFQAVRSKCGGDDLALFLYGNVPAIVDLAKGQMPRAERGMAIANVLGLDTLKGAGYGMSFVGEGFRDTVAIHAPGADHGIVPLLGMKPLTAPRTLDLVPAQAFYWAEGNLPLDTLLGHVRELAGRADPRAVSQLDGALGQANRMLGVDIETELLAGLAGTNGAWMSFPPAGGLYPEVGLVFLVKDPATYEGVFERFATGLAGSVNEEGHVIASTRVLDYQGVKLHLFDMQAAHGDDVVPFTPTWAILKDRLVLTVVPYTMKEIVLRSKGTGQETLATQPDFQSLMGAKPASAGAMEYIDLKAAMTLLYDTAVPVLQTLAKPNVLGRHIPVPLDWAQLPPASRIAGHFSSLAEYVTCNEDGIQLSWQGPLPMLPLLAAVAGATGFATMARKSATHSARVPGRHTAPPYEEPKEAPPPRAPKEAPGGSPSDMEREMDIELARLQAEIYADAVERYRTDEGDVPDDLETLVDDGYVASVTKDPWGETYRVQPKAGGGFVVVSAGPDRRVGTDDDIRLERD